MYRCRTLARDAAFFLLLCGAAVGCRSQPPAAPTTEAQPGVAEESETAGRPPDSSDKTSDNSSDKTSDKTEGHSAGAATAKPVDAGPANPRRDDVGQPAGAPLASNQPTDGSENPSTGSDTVPGEPRAHGGIDEGESDSSGPDSSGPDSSGPDSSDPNAIATDSAAAGGDSAGEAPAADHVAGVATAPPERIILLAPGGPLVVDVLLTLDGDIHLAALADLVDEAYKAADTDGDGRPTWQEVADSPRFRYGQFGNLPITEESQKRQLIAMYDRDDDGLVDRDELPRFVTRNAGRSRSFSLRSANEFRSDNRSRSPVRRAIDTDHNGAITAAEMASAPARLLNVDADDDQIVTLADFIDGTGEMPAQISNRRRTTEPDTALLIDERTRWGYVAFALEELYAYGNSIRAADWPQTPGLFQTLDTDGDGQLGRQEFEPLRTVPAHLQLHARFGARTAADQPPQTELKLETIVPELEASLIGLRSHPRRISLELPRVEIEFFVNEDPALSSTEAVARSQFDTFDTDSNGYLQEDEFPAAAAGLNVPFAGVDGNGDGKVYPDELAAFLELRQRAYRGQVRARAADQPDALFTALDTSGDGRLNAREIAATTEVLAKLDRNQDGQLQSHEIPGSMVLGFVRGNPQQDQSLFVMPIGRVQRRDLPRWFQGMDTNRDGEICSQEFLGTAAQFATRDQNQDGFISPAELQSAELRAGGACK